MSAAPGQHRRDPGVKSSPCRCKRMGWRFRSGNSSEEFGTAANTGAVSVARRPGGDRDGDKDGDRDSDRDTGTAVPVAVSSRGGCARSEGEGVLSSDT